MTSFQVRLYAAHREAAGSPAVTLDLPIGARVRDARAALVRALPPISTAPGTTVIAVNGQFAPDDHQLRAGDQLAAFPPVAGG